MLVEGTRLFAKLSNARSDVFFSFLNHVCYAMLSYAHHALLPFFFFSVFVFLAIYDKYNY